MFNIKNGVKVKTTKFKLTAELLKQTPKSKHLKAIITYYNFKVVLQW